VQEQAVLPLKEVVAQLAAEAMPPDVRRAQATAGAAA
jgi:hypothetical protein